jgi:hypothetical protein
MFRIQKTLVNQSLVDSISRLISETKEGSQEASKEDEEDVP